MRVQGDEATSIKIFDEFIAWVVRCKMYIMLKDEVFRMEKGPNYMTVSAVIRELEKIDMIRGLDGRYWLNHAVTATQKDILRAFRMDVLWKSRRKS